MINIKGACSNQIIKCIIFTNNYEVGVKKLLEIEKDKVSSGISVIHKIMSPRIENAHVNEIKFSDGEEWIILKPDMGARGYRYRKAWVDVKSVTIYDLETFVLPKGSYYKWEDEKYFNW